jgi:hypothetical protein
MTDDDRLRYALAEYFEIMLRSDGGVMCDPDERWRIAYGRADELSAELSARGCKIVWDVDKNTPELSTEGGECIKAIHGFAFTTPWRPSRLRVYHRADFSRELKLIAGVLGDEED